MTRKIITLFFWKTDGKNREGFLKAFPILDNSIGRVEQDFRDQIDFICSAGENKIKISA